jgi:hypothetical protein
MLDDKKEPEFKVTFETLPGNGMHVEADIKFWPRKSELPENLKDLDPELQKRIVDKHLTQKEANASRNMGILQVIATMWMQHNARAEADERPRAGNMVKGPWPNSGPNPALACIRPGCPDEATMVFAGLPFCVHHEEEAHAALEKERAEDAEAADDELDDEQSDDEGPAT